MLIGFIAFFKWLFDSILYIFVFMVFFSSLFAASNYYFRPRKIQKIGKIILPQKSTKPAIPIIFDSNNASVPSISLCSPVNSDRIRRL